MITDDMMPLTVNVPVAEYAYLTRRARYLEAVAVQILRDKRRLREWYLPADLAALGLPGLPTTSQGIGRIARAERWLWRETVVHGRTTREYHCAALPARAFDALIARILAVGQSEAQAVPVAPSVPATLPAPPKPARPADTAPPWVLPLLRVIRQQDKLSIAGAVAALPGFLPSGVNCPTYAEAEAMLRTLGMVAGE